jgi:hypothetical protein
MTFYQLFIPFPTYNNWQWWLAKNEALRQRDHFNFLIVNFPFICSNIPAAYNYGLYISPLIWWINHQRGEDEIVTSINGRNTCMWSSVTHVQILPTQIMMASVKLSNWWLNLATTGFFLPLFVFCSLSFGHCIFYQINSPFTDSSNYNFGLSLWYLYVLFANTH